METRRLEYFVILAQEGSFRRAAEVLFISQPALSQQIHRLEADVGAVLIDRRVQPFELTPAGTRLLAQSMRILNEVGRIDLISERSRRGVMGRIRVGIAPSLMYSRLPEIIRDFRKAFSDIDLTLQREGTASLLDQIADQRIDAGLTFSAPEHDGVAFATIYDDSFVAVLPASHALAARKTVSLDELRTETFLMLTRRGVSDLHDAIIAACSRAGFSPASLETNFQIAGPGFVDQIGLVAAGFGVAIIPSAVSTLTLPSVRYLKVTDSGLSTPTSVAWNPAATNPSTAILVNYITSQSGA